VSAEDWISKSDALDIGRRHCPELSEQQLLQILEDAAGPPPEMITRSDGTKTFELPSGQWPVRRQWKAAPGAHRNTVAYFRPDVERLFSPTDKPTSKRAPKLAKPSPSDNSLQELRTFLEDQHKARGHLTKGDAEGGAWKLTKDKFGDRFTIRRVLQVMDWEPKLGTSKPGRVSKTRKPSH
jgi:hypothetical protein